MEHYHVFLANVIFTCGSAVQRSTFALLLMSLLSHLDSQNPHHPGSKQKPTTGRCAAAGCQL